MAVTDIKVSFRKRGVTDFATDGFRMLPVTKPEYILGLLGADGRIDPSYMPAFLFDARQYLGILDLSYQTPIDIDNVVSLEWSGADASAQGSYLEVTNAGTLQNASANSTNYEIIGAGDEGDNTFPIDLEVGDYLVLAKVNAVAPVYSFAIVNRTHAIADAAQYGVTKLYAGVDSVSDVLAATAGSVKTAYDLAASKEDAFTKNSAFNKNFGTTSTTVARGDHTHSNLDRAAGAVGGNVIGDITISKGAITALSWVSLASIASASGLALSTDLDLYHLEADATAFQSYIEGEVTTAKNMATAAHKQGLEYYTTVANADAGSHNAGDIVAVLET